MAVKKRDPISGAIIYEQTAEEKLTENLRLDIKTLKKEIKNLKDFKTVALSLIQQLTERIDKLENGGN
jgi:hypothetical protein